MLKLNAVALGAMSLVLFTGAVAVGQDRGGDRNFGKDDKKIEKRDDKGAPPVVLGEKELGDMLTTLGHAPKPFKLNNGVTVYIIQIKVDTLNINVSVERSPDGSKLWLAADFQLPAGGIPGDVMQKMLEANAKHGPCHFALNVQGKAFSLAMPMDNRNISSEELQRQIGSFSNALRQTEALWNANKWVPAGGGVR
jgi:hypothetical protein